MAFGVVQRRADLAGAAHLELVSGVAQLHPEDAMVEAMLRGWEAQQRARGLNPGTTIDPRERLVRRFLEFTNEYPWAWTAQHMDEWSLHLTAEEHLAVSTIRGYQCAMRLFSEFLTDGRYGWAPACEQAFAVRVREPGRARAGIRPVQDFTAEYGTAGDGVETASASPHWLRITVWLKPPAVVVSLTGSA